MTLLEYIDRKVADRNEAKRQRDDWKSCRQTVSGFLGENADIDILEVAVPGWTNCYFGYLRTEYRSQKMQSVEMADAKSLEAIAKDNLRKFRRLIIHAIKDGVMPNIDVLSDIPGFGRNKNVVSPSALNELRKLIRRRPDKILTWVDRYLLSICLGGVEPSSLSTLIRDIDLEAKEISLPHLRFGITLTPSLREEIEAFRQRFTDKNIDADGRLNTSFADSIYSVMRSLGVSLFNSKDTFTDWLSILCDFGVPETSVKEIIAAKFDATKSVSTLTRKMINSITDKLVAECSELRLGAHTLSWYAIRSYGKAAEDVLNEISQLAAQSSIGSALRALAADTPQHIYCPCRRATSAIKIPNGLGSRRKVADPQRVVLRNILFVKTSEDALEYLKGQIDNIWIFSTKVSGTPRYTKIPSEEIYNMQVILNFFSKSDDVLISISDTDEDAVSTQSAPSHFEPQDTVTILIPGYEDYEGVVAKRINSSDSDVAQYTITITGQSGVKITMTLPEDLLRSRTHHQAS